MNDQLLRAVFDSAPDALIVVDDEQKFVAANPKACAILDTSLEELLARRVTDFIALKHQPEIEDLWKQFRETGHLQGEVRLVRADKSCVDVEYRATANIAPHRHLSILRPQTEHNKDSALQGTLLLELDANRNRLKGILTNIPGVVWEAWGAPETAAQRINFVSEHIETMLGYSVQDWLSTPNFWLDIVHPDDREHAARVAARTFATGTSHIDEFRWMTKDGRAIWVEARAVVIKNSAGNPIGMRGVTLDISGRKEIEAALQFSEERFRSLFEQSPVAIQILEPGGKTIQVNRAWEKLWGITMEDIKEYNMLEDPQLIAKGVMPYLRRAFEGEATKLPEAFYDPQATLGIEGVRSRWTRPVAYPLLKDGNVTEVVLVHEDISDWKQVQRNLQFLLEASGVLSGSIDYEATLKNLADFAVPVFADYCVVDLYEAGTIRRVALAHRDPEKIPVVEELQRRFPQSLDATHGVPHVLRTGQPEMIEEIFEGMIEAKIHDEEHRALVRQLALKSYICIPLFARGQLYGAITWLRERGSPNYDASDLELAMDLGHRAAIAMENALLYRNATEALASAEAANRAKDDFLAVVSHELRTPLNAISGWASLLRHGSLDTETTKQALEVIERNCYVQGQLVEDILEISRMVGGNLKIERKPIDLTAALEAAMSTIRAAAEAKLIHLDIELETAVIVNGDEVRMQQIVTNLVSNAIKFTPENGRIQIRLSTSEAEAEISIADTGQGISAEFLPHVFERFRQADGSSTRRHGGLGLGLAIVRHLVEVHGGTVRAESAGVGQGATFTVRLPLLRPTQNGESGISAILAERVSQSTPAAQEDAPAAPTRSLRRLSDELVGLEVLVVDDEPDACHLVRFRLESAGAEVVTVFSAREALQELQQRNFSLIISDIAMPDISGYELIEQIRALDDPVKAAITAVALTAFAGPRERERALEAGFQLHLSKPIDSKELIDAIVQLCRA